MVLSRSRTQTRFVVLSPSKLAAPSVFRNIDANNRRHDELFAEMQRFRGQMYLSDGAIQKSDLTFDGRHRVDIDDASWHILSLNPQGRVVSCLRYLDQTNTSSFDDLCVKHAALARCPTMGSRFRTAMQRGLDYARQLGIGFAEVGGWAVAEDHRWTLEPLRIILAAYALAELLGGCSGVATATFRHSSAMILRRIGLSPIVTDGQELPPYYDPQYRCQMEVLQFNSRQPNPKYRESVWELSELLRAAPVTCREGFFPSLHGVLSGFEAAMEPAIVPVAV
jgi:hypothetical protein